MTESLVETATELLRLLSNDTVRNDLLKARQETEQYHRQFLMKTGEMQWKMARREPTEAEQRAILNECLTLTECYLTALECALSKNAFLKLLLDPQSDSTLVQNQAPQEKIWEEVLFVQFKHIEQMVRRRPELKDRVPLNFFEPQQALYPFTKMWLGVTIPTTSAP